MRNALIYGSYGYTGRLITNVALESSVEPILAGRNPTTLAQQAQKSGLPYRSFSLKDARTIDEGLTGIDVVLHCAGPFSQTSKPMADACIRNRVHYLDITGEIEVIEALAARDAEALEGGIMIMPGTGFDVVPSDCLALYLKQRLPTATRLLLGIRGTGPLSHGTATTMVEHRARGGLVRRAGRLVRVPAAWRTRAIDFGDGRLRTAITIPWGDIATAYRTTGIPDIEVYAAVPKLGRYAAIASRYAGRLLATSLVKTLLQGRIDARPAGPDEAELAAGASYVWGRVEDDEGNAAEACVAGPNGYRLTAHAAVLIMQRVLAGDVSPGFQTPARQYGADFVLEIPGVRRF